MPNTIAKFEGKGRHGGQLASVPFYDGSAERAAAGVFDDIGKRFGQMADRAAIREGEAAGRIAGLGTALPDSAPYQNFISSAGGGGAPGETSAGWAETLYTKLMGESALSGSGGRTASAALKLGIPVARAAVGDFAVIANGTSKMLGLVSGQAGGKVQVKTAAAWPFAAPVSEALQRAAETHKVSPLQLAVIAQLESSGDPSAKNPNSSAGGLFQFIDGTARQYGLNNRFDPVASSDAGARLLRDNRQALRGGLGREPTIGELYLAHQQGAAGALGLLKNPNAKAAGIVGAKAVSLNGGTAQMAAADFAKLWTAKADRAAQKMLAGNDRSVPASDVLAYRRPSSAPGVEPLTSGSLPGPSLSAMALQGLGPDQDTEPNPVQLKRNGTLRGDAFDRAAVASYGWRLEAQLTNDVAAAYEQHRDDPAAFDSALTEISARYDSNENFNDPELREVFARRFVDISGKYQRAVAASAAQKRSDDFSAAAVEATDSAIAEMERYGYTLGADREGDAAFASELGRQYSQIDYREQTGALTARQARAARQDLTERAIGARARGVFDTLPDAATKTSYAKQIVEDWAAGEGPIANLDFAAADALSKNLLREAAKQTAEQRSAAAIERAQLRDRLKDDLASIAVTGERADLDPDDVARILGPDAAVDWLKDRDQAEELYAVTSGMKTMTPAEIEAQLQALQPEPGSDGYADQLEFLDKAARRAQGYLEQRERDPAAAADQAYPDLYELKQETDFNDLPAIGELGKRRLIAQEALGIPAGRRQPLTGQEADAVKRILIDQPQASAQLVNDLQDAFGANTSAVFAQIAEDDPGLGFALDLTARGGSGRALATLLTEKRLLQSEGFSPPARSRKKEMPVARDEFQTALQHLPELENGLQENAWLIFSARARSQGLVPDLEEPGMEDMYRQALRDAAGETTANGITYGGLMEVNGLQTLVPPGVAQSEFETVLEDFGRADLADIGPLGSTNNVPISQRLLERSRFVSVGPGLYHVSLGDTAGPDKQYLMRPDGELAVYSFDELKAIQDRTARAEVEKRRARDERPRSRTFLHRMQDLPDNSVFGR